MLDSVNPWIAGSVALAVAVAASLLQDAGWFKTEGKGFRRLGQVFVLGYFVALVFFIKALWD